MDNIKGEKKGLEISCPLKERLECAERYTEIVGDPQVFLPDLV